MSLKSLTVLLHLRIIPDPDDSLDLFPPAMGVSQHLNQAVGLLMMRNILQSELIDLRSLFSVRLIIVCGDCVCAALSLDGYPLKPPNKA